MAKVPGGELEKLVYQEAAGRVPFPAPEAEVRYLEAADVRQGDATRREVILLACHRPVLDHVLDVITAAGLRPVAVDPEPSALLRCYAQQFRRDEDQQQRAMFAHVGAASSVVVIAKGADALFIKYLDIGGRQMDEAVARHLRRGVARRGRATPPQRRPPRRSAGSLKWPAVWRKRCGRFGSGWRLSWQCVRGITASRFAVRR